MRKRRTDDESSGQRVKRARRAWVEKNRDSVAAYNKQWLADNPDYHKQWRAANREHIREYDRRKAARKRGELSTNAWLAIANTLSRITNEKKAKRMNKSR